MFKQNPPKNMRTPLDKNDHPELDYTQLLTGESFQHCLTMIGQLQWCPHVFQWILLEHGLVRLNKPVNVLLWLTPRKASKDLWLYPEDQALLNQVQNQGT